jgi:hypothetical protein
VYDGEEVVLIDFPPDEDAFCGTGFIVQMGFIRE